MQLQHTCLKSTWRLYRVSLFCLPQARQPSSSSSSACKIFSLPLSTTFYPREPNTYTQSQKFQVQYLVQPATFHVVVVVVVVVLIVTHVSISQNFHTSFQKVSLIDTHVSISFQKVSLIDTHVLNSLNFHTYFLRTFHLLTQREPPVSSHFNPTNYIQHTLWILYIT